MRFLRFIRLKKCGVSAMDFPGIRPVHSAPKGRDISAQGKCGGVSRQTPPWGRFQSDEP